MDSSASMTTYLNQDSRLVIVMLEWEAVLCIVQECTGACDAAAATNAYVEAFDSNRSAPSPEHAVYVALI